MEKITVCIPAYNEEESIERCIRSIQQQKLVSIDEILVGTNQSTDNTNKIVTDLIKEDKRIKIVYSPKGKPMAWNYMNKVAKNNIRVFIDGDCYLDELSINNLVKDMADFIMIGGTLNYITDSVSLFSKIIHYPKSLYPEYFDLCGALYLVNYERLLEKMILFGYKDMPQNLIADDRWLVLVSEYVNIARNANVYTHACSVLDQIKRVKRMLISDKQLEEEFSDIYLNINKFDKNKYKIKQEQISNMRIKEKYLYLLILPFKKIINILIFKISKYNMKREIGYNWEKITTSRSK